jgi:hypothetical protein
VRNSFRHVVGFGGAVPICFFVILLNPFNANN